MVRNIVLALSTLAVLIVLFVTYFAMVGEAQLSPDRPGAGAIEEQSASTTQPLRIGQEDIEIRGGRGIAFTRFDERTGRPTDRFRCGDWHPVPGEKNRIHVRDPELTLLLPTGMVAIISAATGELAVDRVGGAEMRPQQGALEGGVTIIVDRGTMPDRPPRDERPEDIITITVDTLAFDLELGELTTDSRLEVVSNDFEIAGRGLNLVWNQADNRIETLTLAEGERFVLYTVGGLFDQLGGATPEESDAVADTQPATSAPASIRPRPRRRADQRTAYRCVLTGDIDATQRVGDEAVGGLSADEISILFDVGGFNADRFIRTRATTQPTSAPTTQPAAQRERLELHWSGPLEITPQAAPDDDTVARRQIEATGNPVILTRGDAAIHCGKLTFHDETGRIWLDAQPNERIAFALGPKLSAASEAVYVDRSARIVKLIGDVELRSGATDQPGARPSTIRSAYWAELHLAAQPATTTRPATDDALVGADRLESATFVGAVAVDLGGQQLAAHRLDIAFRPGTGDESIEDLLDTATASGEVHLTGGDGTVDCQQLGLTFARTPDGALYPRTMDAVGAVVIARAKAVLTGDRVIANLAPPAPELGPDAPTFVLHEITITGNAELIDREHRRAARGDTVTARFRGRNEIVAGTVTGTADDHAVVFADPYLVYGAQIEISRDALSLHVDGKSKLTFKANRTLQGQRRGGAVRIVVECDDELHIDGQRNTVHFHGNVEARSGDEALRADKLVLLLEDLAPPPAPASPPADKHLADLLRQMRGVVRGRGLRAAQADELALAAGADDSNLRKEPTRLIAENALVVSESYDADDMAQPVVHASISAPTLEMDIRNRQIFTNGLTQLLMTDRRGIERDDAVRGALGLPSALLADGPSQTAMQCSGHMIYTIGPEGPDRRDTVVFEDAVVFVHRTGREMINLEQVLPELAGNPARLASLESRNVTLECERLESWFSADNTGRQPQRGGGLTGTPLRLASLIASGTVYLRDQQGPAIREVHANWAEFNREQGTLQVRGAPGADARIYIEDTANNQFDAHTGQELLLNLRDGTLRSGAMQGEIRR
jgi:lipopolysaccharide export system protein LptA